MFVPAGPLADLAGDADDAFAAQRGGALEQFLGQIGRIENGLRAAFAVADVNEDQAAEVAAGMDPAGQSDRLPDVRRAQFVAMMRAFHVQMRIAEFGLRNSASRASEMQFGENGQGISKRFSAPESPNHL